ncbi:MAG: hypothetical protein LC799_23025 [Actinobacteria bacterium]|nr:hypothetical protein [Actinomycetota bacterium]
MIGNAFGDNSTVGDVTVTWNGDNGSATVEDLREAIALLLARVEAAESGASGERIRYELQAIDEELDSEKPDGTVVSSRWALVTRLLGPLREAGGIAQSVEQVLALVRALFGGQ